MSLPRFKLGRLTRGYAVLLTIGPITQMPPLDLYDDILFKDDVGGGTSHTREPLVDIGMEFLLRNAF